MTDLEQEWADQLGSRRFADLKALLTDLGEIAAPQQPTTAR